MLCDIITEVIGLKTSIMQLPFKGVLVFSETTSYIIEVVRLAKYNLYRYIGCIIYQSNWSGPLSLVVMTPDL